MSEQRYWLVSTVLLAAMLLRTLYGRWSGDFWEPSAVVRELATRPLNPSHPLFNLSVAHPFFSPYLLLVGVVARSLSLSPITALALAGMANLAFLLVGLRLFIQALFERDQEVISFYALLLILLAWPASAWSWSGFFHLGVLGYVLPYPSTFAMALTLLILASYASGFPGRPLLRWAVVAALTTIVLLSHPLTAIITFIGIAALSLSETRRSGFRSLFVGGGTLAGAVSLAYLWPYYSFGALLTNNEPEFHTRSHVLYSGIVAIGPTLLLLPIAGCTYYRRLRRNPGDALAMMLITAVLIYLFGYISGHYGVGRIISFIVVLIQIGAAASVTRWERHPPPDRAWLAPALMLLVGGIAVNPANMMTLLDIARGARGQRFDYSEYLAIGEAVHQDAVILADLETSWMLPTFAGKVIASFHPAPWVADHKRRREDLNRFFMVGTSTAERRALLKTYGVDFVLINRRQIASPSYQALGELTLVTDHFLLIAVAPQPPSQER